MEIKFDAKVVKGVGGIYEIRLDRNDADKLRGYGI